MKSLINVLRLTALGLILHTSMAAGGPVDPAAVNDTLGLTEQIEVTKTVQTPATLPDIVFLVDTTGDMAASLPNVQASIADIITQIDAGTSGTPFFAAAQYRDVVDVPLFSVDQGLTSDQAAVNAAVGTWFADGGGDTPECQLYAFQELAFGAVTYRPNAARIVVWFGSAPGHDPCNGVTEDSAIAALQAAEIQVFAVDANTGGAIGLDDTGQATRITQATGGQFFADTGQGVSDAILEALSITVVPQAVGCDPLVVSFDPASTTVTGGNPAVFTETIAVPNDPTVAGQTVNCTVEFRDGDENVLVVEAEDAIQEITIEIPAIDSDGDGVPDDDDFCSNTVIPESIPTRSLGVNRFALVDGDDLFDAGSPNGEGPGRSYAIADTAGCSCTQIIEAQGLGIGHTKFGCSISAMDDWIELVTP